MDVAQRVIFLPVSTLQPSSNRVNIVHLSAPAEFGGLERVVDALVRNRHASGQRVHSVALLSVDDPEPAWHRALTEAGISTRVIRSRSRAYLSELREIRSVLRQLGADIVHTHGYRADTLGYLAARTHGIGTVSTVHGFTRGGGINALYEWLQRRVLRQFDAVIAVSAPLASELAHSGIASAKVATVPNVVTVDLSRVMERHAAREALGLDVGAVVVGWVGRLSHEKAPDLAVEAVATLGDPNVLLALIGDGPMRESLAAQATSRGMEARVRLLGARAEAVRYLRAFDLLLLSSRTEGTPVILLEAALAGMPIVASSVGGVPDLVRHDAWLGEPNAVALADQLTAALSRREERDLRANRLRARIAESCDVRAWVHRHADVYAGVVAPR